MKTKSDIIKRHIHETKFLSCLSTEVGKLAIMRCMDEYAQLKAIEFARWAAENAYGYSECGYELGIPVEVDNWRMCGELDIELTPEQLYHKFELAQAQIAQK